MNFMDKIVFLKNSYYSLDRMVKSHLVLSDSGVPEGYLNQLLEIFPNLPNIYLNFLRNYDDISIEWISLRGSDQYKGVSIFYLIEMWKEDNDIDLIKQGCCPIGEDAAGNLFCLDANNQVVMFDMDNPDDLPKFIADSFDSFMDECVLGKRYPEMSIENSTFHQFLKSQGWA